MTRGKRLKFAGLLGGAAAFVLLLVSPVFGAATVNADHLRLVDGYNAFFHGDDDPGSALSEQFITVGKGTCEFALVGGSLVSVSSNAGGSIKQAGLFDNGMGVKSKGANGTPCSETSHPEIL